MPPPEVGVVTITEQAVALQTELPGRVEPLRVAQVRARVNGVVLKRLFKEGSEVKAGQALFQIDAAPYQASYESAQASLARAQANLTQAAAQAERYKPLLDANAISKQDYINAVAAQKQAEADVASGKAAIATARINLGYASVTSPIAGRIGRALVTEGALVSAAEATQLAVVQQTNMVYVNFTQSTNEVLRLRKAMAAGQLRGAGDGSAAVRVVLSTVRSWKSSLPWRGSSVPSSSTTRTAAEPSPAPRSWPAAMALRRRSTSVVDCVKFTYIGLICCTTASCVASPCPTSAPSVTSARPMRPEMGAVTVA